jgi:membrane protein implicated in regulation of membrane protease activity
MGTTVWLIAVISAFYLGRKSVPPRLRKQDLAPLKEKIRQLEEMKGITWHNRKRKLEGK